MLQRFSGSVSPVYVLVEKFDELDDDVIATQRQFQFAVDVNGRHWFLKRAGQRNADVGMLGLTGAVNNATHHGNFHLLHSLVAGLPMGHLLAKIVLDLVGHILEEGAGGPAATGASGDLRSEAAQFQRLQNLLADDYFVGSIAVG